jgi:hypothetical protein
MDVTKINKRKDENATVLLAILEVNGLNFLHISLFQEALWT